MSVNKRKSSINSDELLLAPMPLPSKDMATTKEVVDPQASQLEGKQESTDNSMDKERSEVWVHFKKQKNSEGKLNGKAICVWCGKSYQALSSQGTSALWKHLRIIKKI